MYRSLFEGFEQMTLFRLPPTPKIMGAYDTANKFRDCEFRNVYGDNCTLREFYTNMVTQSKNSY